MTYQTKQLFDAPLEVCLEKRGSFYRPCVVSSDTKIASVCTKEDANRFARLPELYDALVEVAYEHCQLCIYKNSESASKMPFPNDMATNGGASFCFQNCPRLKHWKLLRKVRDGE